MIVVEHPNIQELGGHTHLSTTMRYMNLAEGRNEQTIRLLDRRAVLAPQGGRAGAWRRVSRR